MVHYGDMTKCYQIFWRSMFQIYFVTYITKYILAVESISNGHLLLQCLVPAVAIRRQPDPTHPQMALLHPTNGNTIVYMNGKLKKIIIWLLCIINCFWWWNAIMWWFFIFILHRKFMRTFHHMMTFQHMMAFHKLMIVHHIWWFYIMIIWDNMIAPQMACRPVRVQTGGCEDVL